MDENNFTTLSQRFVVPGVQAMALMGSFARGEAGRFSDVDVVRFWGTRPPPRTPPRLSFPSPLGRNCGSVPFPLLHPRPPPNGGGNPRDPLLAGSHLVAGRLVVVSDVTPEQVTRWFTEPDEAVNTIAGVRSARILWDPDGVLAAIQTRALAFVWDEGMQAKANRWASEQMVGLIEEVHKGLTGLERDDMGRLLNARFGLSWLLNRVMAVAKGVLLSGDNGFWAEVAAAVGPDSPWGQVEPGLWGE
ncbi:MAG: nucleotidyltransferase domain-containing protein [Chloroflexi bacterium]|nr:nucleotidyltransferase domain-containing protein [Chloroflexota bacterium]